MNCSYYLLSCFLIVLNVLPWGGAFVSAQSHYPGQHKGKLKITETAPLKAYAFDLQDVRLLDSRFTENMNRESEWILSIPVKSLLHSFRSNAGVYSGVEGGYDTIRKLAGWESLDCELRGHTTGHILSGLALLYASTGDDVYKLKADSLVSGLAEVQKTDPMTEVHNNGELHYDYRKQKVSSEIHKNNLQNQTIK